MAGLRRPTFGDPAMSFTCDDVARAAGLEPGRKSSDEQLYRCPNHHDQHPSLSVNPKKDVFLCGPCHARGTAWQFAAFVAGVDPADKVHLTKWLTEHGLLESQTSRRQIV